MSIDGERDGLTASSTGDLCATVESNPRFGPKAFDTMKQYASGAPVPVALIDPDRLFNKPTPRRTSRAPTDAHRHDAGACPSE